MASQLATHSIDRKTERSVNPRRLNTMVPDPERFDHSKWRKEAPRRHFILAASAYIASALRAYLAIEAQISVYSRERFGQSAEVICSLGRALEQLLKLRLWAIDPVLIVPLPKKPEDYLILREIPFAGMTEQQRARRHAELTSNTISFKDALRMARLVSVMKDFNWQPFEELYALRNSLEHGWQVNESYLRRIVGNLSTITIPSFQRFISEDLGLDPLSIFSKAQIREVDILERARAKSHSLAMQKRLEAHQALFARNPDEAKRSMRFPERYGSLSEQETEVSCPVCRAGMFAWWDWDVDYDEDGPVGAYPDVKCLHCHGCSFYIEGADVGTYLPDGIEVEPEYPDSDY